MRFRFSYSNARKEVDNLATYTDNYNLLKPDEEDFYSIEDFNDNMDTIDALLAENETATNGIDAKIGNPGDTGTDTLFGAMNNGGAGSIIRKIQYVTVTRTHSISETLSIEPVDTTKTFVILEFLKGRTDGTVHIDYKLKTDGIRVDATVNDGGIALGFWVIEFK